MGHEAKEQSQVYGACEFSQDLEYVVPHGHLLYVFNSKFYYYMDCHNNICVIASLSISNGWYCTGVGRMHTYSKNK